jgi:hypothetical protein
MESSCEFGVEPSGSIKCWKLSGDLKSSGPSSSAQLHGISLVSYVPSISQTLYCLISARLDMFPYSELCSVCLNTTAEGQADYSVTVTVNLRYILYVRNQSQYLRVIEPVS